jgi:hypothetical protein
MTLKQRLGMLRGVYGEEMPYRDPHTAAPALWAMRHKDGCHFEVSISVVAGTTQWRKGMEAVAIALYRQQHGRSPAANFGRMPAGYRMSSCNNARLVATGKRSRGGLTEEVDASHEPSIAPVGTLKGDVGADDWCGHQWSSWHSLPSVLGDPQVSTGSAGLYRLHHKGAALLLYIGQGRVLNRLSAHWRKTFNASDMQGRIFGAVSHLECSWVMNDFWLSHQRLELENDLIAAHILNTGQVPVAQFIGGAHYAPSEI